MATRVEFPRQALTGRRARRFSNANGGITPYLLLLPFVFFLIAFAIVPLGASLLTSIQSDNPGHALVGLDNYNQVVGDPDFQHALLAVGRMILFGVPVFVIFTTGVALLLDLKVGSEWIKRFVRLLYFLPFAVPASVGAFVWGYVYAPNTSPYNALFRIVGITDQSFFFGGTRLAYSVLNIVIWANAGAWMIVLFAALQGLPHEIQEAARMDGASEWQVIWQIKLPAIRQTIVFMLISVFAYTLQLFTEPHILEIPANVPSNYTPAMWSYDTAFSNGYFGLAEAASFLLAFAAIGVAVVFIVGTGAHREHQA